jgi:hypothetical protein
MLQPNVNNNQNPRRFGFHTGKVSTAAAACSGSVFSLVHT